jgi:hypothetical protein
MTKYKILIDNSALQDIQEITDWYNEQLSGLGTRCQNQVKKQINTLKINPQAYGIRYSDIRCMLIKKFPFLVHFVVDEAAVVVEIFAVIHTSRNPTIWEERRMK